MHDLCSPGPRNFVKNSKTTITTSQSSRALHGPSGLNSASTLLIYTYCYAEQRLVDSHHARSPGPAGLSKSLKNKKNHTRAAPLASHSPLPRLPTLPRFRGVRGIATSHDFRGFRGVRGILARSLPSGQESGRSSMFFSRYPPMSLPKGSGISREPYVFFKIPTYESTESVRNQHEVLCFFQDTQL